MLEIREINSNETYFINEIVQIHLKSFTGFFLTFLGKGFLRQLYTSYCEHTDSGLIVAFNDNSAAPIGFVAYSKNMSDLYKYMIRRKIGSFIWYSFCAFLRNPRIFLRLIRALLKPKESKRNEDYVELASIAVLDDQTTKGVGGKLINYLVNVIDFSKYTYINLETDAEDNESVNKFYQNHGFVLERTYKTTEKRKMNEYRYYGNKFSEDI